MVFIHADYRAMQGESTIERVVRSAEGARYTLSEIYPGPAQRRLQFPGRPDEPTLPEGHLVHVIIFGRGKYITPGKDGAKDEFVRITHPALLFGVRVDVETDLFKAYRSGPYVTGVVFDASEEDRAAYQMVTPVPQPEIQQAHRWLYQETQERIPPRGLSRLYNSDKMHVIISRAEDQSSFLKVPLVSARDWADISVRTLF